MRIHKNSLIQVAKAILTSAGAEADRAHAVAEHLVIANLKGHDSHGVGTVSYTHLTLPTTRSV